MKKKTKYFIIFSIILTLITLVLTSCGTAIKASSNKGIEPTNNVSNIESIPKDIDLEVLEVRELMGRDSYGQDFTSYPFYPFGYFTIDVLLKDSEGNRYNFYYSCREVFSVIEESYLDENYLSLAKLTKGDYIKYDSTKNKMLFSYQ